MKKILLIIIDGLGDKPISRLDNKTPLEAAKTPNLDWLAKNGICGQMQPFQFSWQRFPESDTAHLAIFGYNPKKYYLGRGVYEAAGVGLNLRELKKRDVVLRANFATVDNNLRVIDRRAGRISKTQPLVKYLNGTTINGVKFLLKKSLSYRAVLILRGKNLSKEITDGDPHETGKKVLKIKPKIKKAGITAKVLNEFLERAHQILENHPFNKKRKKRGLPVANYLLVRGAGQFKKTPSFRKRYKLSAACVAGGPLYKGIAKILGMDLIKVRGATGLLNTNLKGKFLAAKKALKKPAPYRPAGSGTGAGYDFVFCHIKAADSLAEDGNFRGKKMFIEKIDKNLKPLLGLKNTLIVITADHSTCCNLKRHCSIPVPVLIYGSKIKLDKRVKFSERACRKGKLGTIKQLGLMPKILFVSKWLHAFIN